MTQGDPGTIPSRSAVPEQTADTGDPAPRFRVERVPRTGWISAAERLVQAVVGTGKPARAAAERFLAAAGEHRIDLAGLHASFLHDSETRTPKPRQVCLAVPGSGATATFFTTTPQDDEESAELAAVIDAACAALGGTRLAQALLTLEEDAVRAAFAGAAFRQICQLAYLTGPLHTAIDKAKQFDAGTMPEGVEVVRCDEIRDEELTAALRASYEQTLDCPELCALRRTEDVLASHKDAGQHDPKLWWLVRHHGEPRGAAFVSRMPEQSAMELVYLGLAPSLRGKGLGRSLLAHALTNAGRSGLRDFQCAVDLRNAPALKLYAGFGLRETARRRALVRALAL